MNKLSLVNDVAGIFYRLNYIDKKNKDAIASLNNESKKILRDIFDNKNIIIKESKDTGFDDSIVKLFFEGKSTGANHIRIDNTASEQWVQNWYCYFYNLGNSNKYSFVTFQKVPKRINTSGNYNASGTYIDFGGGVLPQASEVDGIRVYNSSQTASAGNIKLYGVKQ